jgi:hypothetical protein
MSINAVNSNGKVTTAHLKKTAYIYIRQSTLRQVFENIPISNCKVHDGIFLKLFAGPVRRGPPYRPSQKRGSNFLDTDKRAPAS